MVSKVAFEHLSLATYKVLFLCWEPPWPARGGGSLRTLGLLRQIARFAQVELLIASQRPLQKDQSDRLGEIAHNITRVPLRRFGLTDHARTVRRMLIDGVPYHCALLRESFGRDPEILAYMREYDGVVYASYGHWGTLLDKPSRKWILDQQNADVQFWRAYVDYASGLRKLAAWFNGHLAARHFPEIYADVARIISVCEHDRDLTHQLAPTAQIDVIENGVDCTFMKPGSRLPPHPPRLLFTGTSAVRNVKALRGFTNDVWPRILASKPDATTLVAGNFRRDTQLAFSDVPSIEFTGCVDDIRPYFDPNDVFIAPFHETHGSKLKIAEAMAMGMPIVATPQGVQGFPAQHGENALVAEDAVSFAKYCVELLADMDTRRCLGLAARRTAVNELDWSVIGDRLRCIVEQVALRSKQES